MWIDKMLVNLLDKTVQEVKRIYIAFDHSLIFWHNWGIENEFKKVYKVGLDVYTSEIFRPPHVISQ